MVPRLSDAELVTLAVLQALLGFDSTTKPLNNPDPPDPSPPTTTDPLELTV